MSAISSVHFYCRDHNQAAQRWSKQLSQHLAQNYPQIKLDTKTPELVVALGGDGTILAAARRFPRALILGFNLGTVGFLAAVHEEDKFASTLGAVLAGKFKLSERNLLEATVKRGSNQVYSETALNDIVVTSPLSMVHLSVEIDGYPYQFIRGSGLLVATATGSTAYNISAHGPIVEAGIGGIIVNELLDHNTPTPPLVVKESRTVTIGVTEFREHGQLKLAGSAAAADVVLSADGASVFPLEKGDVITVRTAKDKIKFVEIDDHHFFANLQDKFAIE